MMNVKLNTCYALASAAVLGIAACSGGTDGSSQFAAPTGPLRDVSVTTQTARVCKVGPVGTYNFTLVFGGSSYGTDVKATSPATLTVTDPATPVCTTVLSRSAYPGGTIDPAATVQITEQAAAGTGLQSIVAVGGAAPSTYDAANRRVTVAINAFHSVVATFTNVAVGGCTFTQGWYKNHETQWPTGFSPSASFDGWGTWLDLYKTPPKGGNAYIQLAHQYMTALMNVANGASVPADVQTALNQAALYFAAGGNGAGAGDIAGVAGILDAYNNGVTGPGHCD